jgi:hypothetical protein
MTLPKIVVDREFAESNNGIMPDTNPELDSMKTECDTDMKKEVEERKFHRMAMVLEFLEMWWHSQNLRATQKESCAPNKQTTAVGYIQDTEEIAIASQSLFQHDSAAGFKLTERSPFPPSLSAKNLSGEHSQILNVH